MNCIKRISKLTFSHNKLVPLSVTCPKEAWIRQYSIVCLSAAANAHTMPSLYSRICDYRGGLHY